METNENAMASRLNELKQVTTEIGSIMYDAFNTTNKQLEEMQEAVIKNTIDLASEKKLDGLIEGVKNLHQFIDDLLRIIIDKELVGHIVSIASIETTLEEVKGQLDSKLEIPYKNAVDFIQHKRITRITINRDMLSATMEIPIVEKD